MCVEGLIVKQTDVLITVRVRLGVRVRGSRIGVRGSGFEDRGAGLEVLEVRG